MAAVDENYSPISDDRSSTMSVLAHTPGFAYRQAPRTLPQPGPFRRLLRSLLQWRQRRAEQDIAFHLGLTSGHITDEIERRMNERLFSNGGFRR
jgi:hypothetical protein